MKNPKFDDIRPYYDDEIPAAMQRITNSNFFPLLASYVFPDENVDNIKNYYALSKQFQTFNYK